LKLQVKLALYNAISKALIIAAIGISLPIILQKVVYKTMDERLEARLAKMMHEVHVGGIKEIMVDQDCSFDDYNIFKEEFVSIRPLKALPKDFGKEQIVNAERNIENEIVQHRVLSKTFLFDNQLYEIEIGEGLSHMARLNNTLHNFSVTFLIIIVIISFFIDLGYVELLLRPFYKIVNQKLESVHHPTIFKPEKIKTNTYEFAYLDDSINEMMRKVKDAFQTEKEFITNVSHELLTPVSILKNRNENILADVNIPQEIAIKIFEQQKTLNRLTKIVKALLYISKIENEQYLKNETVGIKELVQEVLDEIDDRLKARNISMSQQWTDDFPCQNCNRSLLYTMIFNLVSNAIKYNKENGEIFIAGRKENDHFVLIIKDTGVGISKEHLPHIFDRFKRFRPDDEISYGLGLPIVKSIADFHHLKINVDSELNQGTVFTIYFT
jgi:two-component system sensor histidine kinase ArlS